MKSLLAAFALLAPLPLATAQAPSTPLVALVNGGTLVRFSSASPGTTTASVAITGLLADELLVGIDVRPLDKMLYGVGSTSRLYRIDMATGVATAVSSAPFATALSGNRFGVDFNPTNDLLRIVSDAGQNLRVSPSTGALVSADAALSYLSPSGFTPRVVSAAYANNFAGATSTRLYDVETNLAVLAVQLPPNNGTLSAVADLAVPLVGPVGFDISASNDAFLASNVRAANGPAVATLYQVNLATGQTIALGAIAAPSFVIDIAVVL